MEHLDQLVNEGKSRFQSRDFETCMALMREVLREDARNAEAAWLLKEAERQWEDQRSLEEFEIYVENLKKEAMDLFDDEQYEQCMSLFKFLQELEPENHNVCEYLKLSQQMFLESLGSRGSAAEESSDQDLLPTTEAAVQPAVNLPDVNLAIASSLSSERELESLVRRIEGEQGPQALEISRRNEQRIINEFLASQAARKKGRNRLILLGSLVLVLSALAWVRVWLYPLLVTSNLGVRSNPAGAQVTLDNEIKGRTPFQAERIPAGQHTLRLEKEGYQPYTETLGIKTSRTVLLVVQLEKTQAQPSAPREYMPPTVSEPTPETPLAQPESDPEERQDSRPEIAYSVIHHHLLGSCTGRLRISGDIVSFKPSGSSKDGFRRRVKELVKTDLDDRLTLQFKDRNYNFEALGRNQRENREKLAALYQRVKR